MFRKSIIILTLISGLIFLAAGVLNFRFMEDIRQELSLGKMDKILVREPSRYHIGLIIPDVEDSFFRDLIQGIEGSAPEADGVVQVLWFF